MKLLLSKPPMITAPASTAVTSARIQAKKHAVSALLSSMTEPCGLKNAFGLRTKKSRKPQTG